MLGWFPSDDRQSKYERFWFFDGKIFYSNHENTHARTPRRSDPQEIIWEGLTEVLPDGHMHQEQGQN